MNNKYFEATQMVKLLICFVVFIFFINSAHTQHVTYDDLSLKLCDKDKSDRVWSIHGWWPEFSKHKYPSWCNKTRYTEFSINKLKPIISFMKKHWYTCPGWKSTNDKQFWLHEWEKHGTCIPQDSVLEFFSHAINAYKKAKDNDWYGCCKHKSAECLIPHSKTLNQTKWLGWCYKRYDTTLDKQGEIA